jgi:hypothetical protein
MKFQRLPPAAEHFAALASFSAVFQRLAQASRVNVTLSYLPCGFAQPYAAVYATHICAARLVCSRFPNAFNNFPQRQLHRSMFIWSGERRI